MDLRILTEPQQGATDDDLLASSSVRGDPALPAVDDVAATTPRWGAGWQPQARRALPLDERSVHCVRVPVHRCAA